MNKFTFFLFVLLLVGCESGDQAKIDSINKELKNLDKESSKTFDPFDLNRDGISDVTIEKEDGFYYELIDSNFDGKVDESWKYTLDEVQIGGKVDQDDNGILETEFITLNGSFIKELADSNNNFIYDIYTKYDHGRIKYAEKYYSSSSNTETAKIGRINYKFGYPEGPEVIIETKLTEKEFEYSRLKE